MAKTCMSRLPEIDAVISYDGAPGRAEKVGGAPLSCDLSGRRNCEDK